MKLYYWLRDWQLPGHQDKGASRVEIPTDAAGLCAWLNERKVPICLPLNPPAEPVPVVAAAPVAATPRGARLLQDGRELDQFEEWIDRAEGWQLVRLVGMVTHRLSDLTRSLPQDGGASRQAQPLPPA